MRGKAPGAPAGDLPGLLIDRRGYRYVAELRVSREARRAELAAHLADAFVRAQVGARAHRARPLAVVGAPSISDELAGELAVYATRFFGDAAWGVIDGSGRLQLHGEGLLDFDERPSRRARKEGSGRHPAVSEVFSELGQWLLKVLLAHRIESRWLSAPRDARGSVRRLS